MERVIIRCNSQPGFVRGDTLRDVHEPQLFCVLTEWDTASHLKKWLEEKDYKQLLHEMDTLLGKPVRYQIFQRNKEEIFLL